MELREREAQRMCVVGGRQIGTVGVGRRLARPEELRIERRGLGGPERDGSLARPAVGSASGEPIGSGGCVGHERRHPRGREAELFRRRNRGLHGAPSRRARATRACWTNWWTAPDSRKRTSLFCGCTLTSTCRGSSVEPQRVRGLAFVMQHVPVGLAQRVHQHPVPDEAAVDEHVLARHLRRVRGLHGEAGDRERPRLRLDRRRAVDERVAQQRGDARAPAVRQQPMHQAAVVRQREADVRMGERDAAERLVAMAPFGRLRAQELPPRRRVEVELLRGHGRAGRDRRRRRRTDIAAVDLDAPRVRRAAPRATRARTATPPRSTPAPRRESPASRSRRDRPPSRAWTSHAARRRARSSSRAMPAPLSATRMRRMPPPSTIDVDLRRARVERVLEQLLQRRGRALDDLARGDLIDEVVGQRLNPGHGKGSGQRERGPYDKFRPSKWIRTISRDAQSNRPTPGRGSRCRCC